MSDDRARCRHCCSGESHSRLASLGNAMKERKPWERGANVTCNYASSFSPLFRFLSLQESRSKKISILSQTLYHSILIWVHWCILSTKYVSSLNLKNEKPQLAVTMNWPHGAPCQMDDLPSPWDHNVGREKNDGGMEWRRKEWGH